MTTPLHTVKEKFGSKAKLVEQLVGLVQRQTDESDAELTERLMRVSNRKLITLHQPRRSAEGFLWFSGETRRCTRSQNARA